MGHSEQITQESGVALVALEVRPLPPFHASYHMIDHENHAAICWQGLLQNGDQRYRFLGNRIPRQPEDHVNADHGLQSRC